MRSTLIAARKFRGIDSPAALSAITRQLGGDYVAVSRSTIYRLESGAISNPNTATVESLEAALGLARGTLVFGHRGNSTDRSDGVQRECAVEGSAK
jgi:transcriptional regulator with XRE-family HTH domain